MIFHILFAVSVVLAVSSLGIAEDDFSPQSVQNWAQWRGPHFNGTSPEGTPPITWSETENIRWQRDIPGRGSGSPIIWGNQLFLVTAVATDKQAENLPEKPAKEQAGGRRLALDAPTVYYQFIVMCLDRMTGETIWEHVAREAVPHEGGHPTNTFASGSPVTDGKRLYVSFGTYGVYCYDLNGELKWSRDLGKMETRNDFGEANTPALYGNTLVIPWDHEQQSFIVALDAKTGETNWKVDRDEPTTWATPLITTADGVTQVVTNGTNRVRSYNIQNGELLWECGGQATNPIACPVRYENLAIAMTGYRGYAIYAVPLSARGDVTDSDRIAWKRTDTGPYISSPMLSNGTLYVTKGRDAIVSGLNPHSGETIIEQTRIPGLGTLYASPVSAAGRLYYTDREGTTVVLEDGPELKVLATNHLKEVIDASPAIIGRQMYLRGEHRVFCVEDLSSE
ncbi:MAG: PQQ-binding-like beta-propeller repeat protein [Planctomycetaceae bacterium]|nr:PQQ-binding-like beta-propeller repeat protein [Planctomycetaceae bacterium]